MRRSFTLALSIVVFLWSCFFPCENAEAFSLVPPKKKAASLKTLAFNYDSQSRKKHSAIWDKSNAEHLTVAASERPIFSTEDYSKPLIPENEKDDVPPKKVERDPRLRAIKRQRVIEARKAAEAIFQKQKRREEENERHASQKEHEIRARLERELIDKLNNPLVINPPPSAANPPQESIDLPQMTGPPPVVAGGERRRWRSVLSPWWAATKNAICNALRRLTPGRRAKRSKTEEEASTTTASSAMLPPTSVLFPAIVEEENFETATTKPWPILLVRELKRAADAFAALVEKDSNVPKQSPLARTGRRPPPSGSLSADQTFPSYLVGDAQPFYPRKRLDGTVPLVSTTHVAMRSVGGASIELDVRAPEIIYTQKKEPGMTKFSLRFTRAHGDAFHLLKATTKIPPRTTFWMQWKVNFDYRSGVLSFVHCGDPVAHWDLKRALLVYTKPPEKIADVSTKEFHELAPTYLAETTSCPKCAKSEVVAGIVQLAYQVLYGFHKQATRTADWEDFPKLRHHAAEEIQRKKNDIFYEWVKKGYQLRFDRPVRSAPETVPVRVAYFVQILEDRKGVMVLGELPAERTKDAAAGRRDAAAAPTAAVAAGVEKRPKLAASAAVTSAAKPAEIDFGENKLGGDGAAGAPPDSFDPTKVTAWNIVKFTLVGKPKFSAQLRKIGFFHVRQPFKVVMEGGDRPGQPGKPGLQTVVFALKPTMKLKEKILYLFKRSQDLQPEKRL